MEFVIIMNEISEEFSQVHGPKNETHFVTTPLLSVEGRLGGDPCLCRRLTNPERSRGVAEGQTHDAPLIARKLSARLLPPWNPVRVCVFKSSSLQLSILRSFKQCRNH